MSQYLSSDNRTSLHALVEKKPFAAPRLTFQHLSLADRYWQFRLQAYRYAFMDCSPAQVNWEHASPLGKQAMIDIHPTFGSYFLYIRALQTRLEGDFQGSLNLIHFAMEWINSWRVRGDMRDLNERV
jgi:hypothetical protein